MIFLKSELKTYFIIEIQISIWKRYTGSCQGKNFAIKKFKLSPVITDHLGKVCMAAVIRQMVTEAELKCCRRLTVL